MIFTDILTLRTLPVDVILLNAQCIVADHLPVVIHGEEIAQIGQYKYLGVHLDNKFSQNVHVHSACSKVHQRWSWQLDHADET